MKFSTLENNSNLNDLFNPLGESLMTDPVECDCTTGTCCACCHSEAAVRSNKSGYIYSENNPGS